MGAVISPPAASTHARASSRTSKDTLAPAAWDETSIRARADSGTSRIIDIWPVPTGYRSAFKSDKPTPHHRIDIADLINADQLQAGVTLVPRRRKFLDVVATLLPTGELDVGGVVYPTPSAAAESVVGHKTSGWWFFLVDKPSRRSLRDVRRDYLDSLSEDLVTDDEDDADDDEDDS
jgi:Restriction Enzyme Adenine Methylase Associated